MEENTAAVIEETAEVVAEVSETTAEVEEVETSGEEVAAPEEAGEVVETQEEKANRAINNKIAKYKTRARRAEENLEYYQKQNQGQPPPPAAVEDKEPVIDDFATYDEFIVEKSRHAARQEFKTLHANQTAQSQEQAYKTKKAELVTKGTQTHPDYYDVVTSVPISEFTAAAATNLEKGSEALYYLGTNPAEAQRINGLDPVAQVIELTKISNQLAATPVKQPSKAPAPISPVGTTGDAGELKYHPDMSQQDYAKLRAQRKKR